MEALKIDSDKLRKSNRGITVSEFREKDFKIGKYKFRWNTVCTDGFVTKILYVKSNEIFGKGIRFRVKNQTQLIFQLATNDNQCTVCIGEDGYEVELRISWLLENEGPQLINEGNESEE